MGCSFAGLPSLKLNHIANPVRLPETRAGICVCTVSIVSIIPDNDHDPRILGPRNADRTAQRATKDAKYQPFDHPCEIMRAEFASASPPSAPRPCAARIFPWSGFYSAAK